MFPLFPGYFVRYSVAFACGFGFVRHHFYVPIDAQYTADLKDHPYAKALFEKGYDRKPTLADRIPSIFRRHMVTSNTMAGMHRLECKPASFSRDGDFQTLYYFGNDLSGEPVLPRTPWYRRLSSWWFGTAADHVVHNGAAITIMDECLARVAFEFLPNKLGVTAILNVEPLRDIEPGTFVVLKAKHVTCSGRKSSAVGSIYALNGDKLGPELVRGDILMVEPSWASSIAWFMNLWTL